MQIGNYILTKPYIELLFGRHLDFLKMLNDDRVSSVRLFNGNI